MVAYPAHAVGSALQRIVMKDDQIVVTRASDVDLNDGCAHLEGGSYRLDGVFDVLVGRGIDMRGLAPCSTIVSPLFPIGMHSPVSNDVKLVWRGHIPGTATMEHLEQSQHYKQRYCANQ
jgi:hypothetical protein